MSITTDSQNKQSTFTAGVLWQVGFFLHRFSFINLVIFLMNTVMVSNVHIPSPEGLWYLCKKRKLLVQATLYINDVIPAWLFYLVTFDSMWRHFITECMKETMGHWQINVPTINLRSANIKIKHLMIFL